MSADTAWRIDTLDARGGLAFASWRDDDLLSGALQPDRAAMFLSPPGFRPEVVANRATGFSASRSRAQLGVFVDGDELAFESLDHLTEFVRRVYVASGGGDAGGGGRPRPPPIPEGGPDIGEGPGFERERQSAAQIVVLAAHEALSRSTTPGMQLKPGRPTPASKFTPSASSCSEESFQVALEDGAAELVLEFLRRYPINGPNKSLVAWSEGAHRLGAGIDDLWLWPAILSGPLANEFDNAAHQIARSIPEWAGILEGRQLIPHLLGGRIPFPWSQQPPWIREEFYYYPIRHNLSGFRRRGDPIDDLSAWPLPHELRTLIGSGQSDPTALNLLSAINGAPGKLGNVPAEQGPRRASSILLFCVAHVLAEAEPMSGFTVWTPDIASSFLAELGERCLDWMFQQWPTFIFPLKVESMIGSVSRLSTV